MSGLNRGQQGAYGLETKRNDRRGGYGYDQHKRGWGLKPVKKEKEPEESTLETEKILDKYISKEIYSLIKTKNEEQKVPVDNINLCFVGGVSTGKSTILNSIFCEELTQCKIKRTTMVPTVYIENDNESTNLTPPEQIYEQISNKNKELIDKTENHTPTVPEDYSELVFNVGKLDINILEESYVNVYDIPGLNDARTKTIYYNYLQQNFDKFNLVVFIVDLHSGMNTSDEIDILNFITSNTLQQIEANNKQIYTLVVVNKADDMQLGDNGLELTGELGEMYEQVVKTVSAEFSRKKISENLIGIVPLCAIDSYLYRMVKKHGNEFKLSPEQILKIGINENGKKFSKLKPQTQEQKVREILNDTEFINTMIDLSGFGEFVSSLNKFLSNGKSAEIRLENLRQQMLLLPEFTVYAKFQYDIDLFKNTMKIYSQMRKIDEGIGKTYMRTFYNAIKKMATSCISGYHWDNMKELHTNYLAYINECITPYLSEFVEASEPLFPHFITNWVNTEINAYMKKIITIEDIINSIEYYKLFGIFNQHYITDFIENIINNPRGVNTISFIHEETDTDSEIDSKIIKILDDDIHDLLGPNICEFIRFIIINKLQHCTIEELCSKQILYNSENEKIISSYIGNLIARQNSDIPYMAFVRGTLYAQTRVNNALDNYYLMFV